MNHSHKNTLTSSEGFFLIEKLLAAALISTVAISVSGLFFLSQNVTSFGIYQTMAVAIAQDKIEELKAVPFSELKAAGNQTFTENIFERRIDFERMTTLVWDKDLVEIMVTVSWEGRQMTFVTCRGDF